MMQRSTWMPVIALSGGLMALAAGCKDPLREAQIEQLGDEQDGFEPSEIHRPGQPCLACHDSYGDAEPEMSFGGTLFLEPPDAVPEGEPELILLEGYHVRLIDSEGQEFDLPVNRCGNFFIEKEAFEPAFPVRAEVWNLRDADDPEQLRVMSTRIGRDGSCGSCHIHPASPFSPGVVFLPEALLDESDLPVEPPTGCPEPRFAEPL